MNNTTHPANGILKRLPKGGGFIRDPEHSFKPTSTDVWVSSNLIKKFNLCDGAMIEGSAQEGGKGLQLKEIHSICGIQPEKFANRVPFERLAAINPGERFPLGVNGDESMRIAELMAPFGKGTRALIVSPPKSGKTTLLEKIAHSIDQTGPNIRVLVLLIDERPEEVTHFRRNVPVEVLASSSDESIESHVQLVELTLAQIRCELECGRDVVLLVDSLTRLARAFNQHDTGSRRTLSGGLDARALEVPRRFFGLARNVENGGSVTVIATIQVNTGSRMDDYIFEEFKSTGNSELVLDRDLADARIFPAVNIRSSGTRREEFLYEPDEVEQISLLRRWLVSLNPDKALLALKKLVNTTSDNRQLLKRFEQERMKSLEY